MKISITDKKVRSQFFTFLSVTSLLVTLVLAFVDFEKETKYLIGIIYLGMLVAAFFCIWLHANLMRKTSIKINNSTVNILFGDIFERKEYKVIGFNEYFDTLVDDKLISSNSLNGQYLTTIRKGAISELNEAIENDVHLHDRIVSTSVDRISGKTTKYKLGSLFTDGDFLLLALTHFDSEQKANLTLQEYTDCLMSMWNEIDRVYGGKSVSIPLLGSGITRMKDCQVSDQELLEIIIWTYRISKVKFTYPAKLNIVLNYSKRDKYSLFNLRGD